MSLSNQILNLYKTQIKSLEIIPSLGGVFEVRKDGELVFSKKESGRFPEWDEVRGALE